MAEAASDFLVLIAPDRRSDNGRRLIAVTRHYVLIERHVGGVKMRIAVPIAAFRGVALTPRHRGSGCEHVVSLAHRDLDLCVELEAANDGAAMALRQQHWAGYLNSCVLAADTARPTRRRRGSAVAKRRSRFLGRRKPGDSRRTATVFDNGREIICYE
jgi:hypothetical protein